MTIDIPKFLESIQRMVAARINDVIVVSDDDFADLVQYVPPTEVEHSDEYGMIIRWGGRYSNIVIRRAKCTILP